MKQLKGDGAFILLNGTIRFYPFDQLRSLDVAVDQDTAEVMIGADGYTLDISKYSTNGDYKKALEAHLNGSVCKDVVPVVVKAISPVQTLPTVQEDKDIPNVTFTPKGKPKKIYKCITVMPRHAFMLAYNQYKQEVWIDKTYGAGKKIIVKAAAPYDVGPDSLRTYFSMYRRIVEEGEDSYKDYRALSGLFLPDNFVYKGDIKKKKKGAKK